jgi:hypothetical protein
LIISGNTFNKIAENFWFTAFILALRESRSSAKLDLSGLIRVMCCNLALSDLEKTGSGLLLLLVLPSSEVFEEDLRTLHRLLNIASQVLVVGGSIS